jgi:hypothetical protein
MCGAMKMDFWKNSSKWPHDMVDAVFLARAFHSIGEAMFGPAWTGEEPSVDPPLSKPGALMARFATDALRVQAEIALKGVQLSAVSTHETERLN